MSIRVMVASFLIMGLVAPAALGEKLPPPKIVNTAYANGALSLKVESSFTPSSYIVTIDRTAVTASMSDLQTLSVPANQVPPNKEVTLTVVAVDAQGTLSQPSSPVVSYTPPAAPTGVKGTPGKNMIVVSWSPVPGAASYRVTLSNGQSFTTTSTSYTFTGLPTATTYNCIVWAYNAAGAQSVGSAPVSVKTANVMLEQY